MCTPCGKKKSTSKPISSLNTKNQFFVKSRVNHIYYIYLNSWLNARKHTVFRQLLFCRSAARQIALNQLGNFCHWFTSGVGIWDVHWDISVGTGAGTHNLAACPEPVQVHKL